MADIPQIILAIATLITSIGGVIIGIRNTRKINTVHDLTNSLATRAEISARARGNLEGRAEQTAEKAANE